MSNFKQNQFMQNYTFKHSIVKSADGREWNILTANEYPWMNIQIIEITEGKWNESIEKLKNAHRTAAAVPGRMDFVAIQAGGGSPDHPAIEITQQNYREVIASIQECLRQGAAYWASTHWELG